MRGQICRSAWDASGKLRVRCHGPLRRGDVAENLGANGVQRYDPFDGGLGLSLATRVGSLVFTSWMVGFDGATGSVPADLEEEIRLAFTNLGNVLSEMGPRSSTSSSRRTSSLATRASCIPS